MAKYTIEVDDWLALRDIAPIAQLIEFVPSTNDGEIDYVLIDAESAIPRFVDGLSEIWVDKSYSVHGRGLDLSKWLDTATRLERLAGLIRERIAAE